MAHQIAESNPWRDMSGDARTTQQHLRNGDGRPQCSLSAVRNLYRDQAYSAEELAEHVAGGDGDIRFPDWAQLLEPLCGAREVYRQFKAERVRSELLGDVRLAARSRVNSGHVTALVRAENGRSFRHYDNDSGARQCGTSRHSRCAQRGDLLSCSRWCERAHGSTQPSMRSSRSLNPVRAPQSMIRCLDID